MDAGGPYDAIGSVIDIIQGGTKLAAVAFANSLSRI